jgi:hypothetical protein
MAYSHPSDPNPKRSQAHSNPKFMFAKATSADSKIFQKKRGKAPT